MRWLRFTNQGHLTCEAGALRFSGPQLERHVATPVCNEPCTRKGRSRQENPINRDDMIIRRGLPQQGMGN
jgi:hypothetical protein